MSVRIVELVPDGPRLRSGEEGEMLRSRGADGRELPAGQLSRHLLEEISGIDDKIFETNQWGIESFEDSIKNDYDFLIAAVEELPENRTVGFGLLRCFDDAEVIRIAVRPEDRRKGYGRKLLDEMLAECRRRQVPNIFLEVRSGNAAAIGLYQEAGFTAEGIRKAYYRQPTEDALIMRYTC